MTEDRKVAMESFEKVHVVIRGQRVIGGLWRCYEILSVHKNWEAALSKTREIAKKYEFTSMEKDGFRDGRDYIKALTFTLEEPPHD